MTPLQKALKRLDGMKQEKIEKCSHCGGKGDTFKCQGGSDWVLKDAYNQALTDIKTLLPEILKEVEEQARKEGGERIVQVLREKIGKLETPEDDVACDYANHVDKDDVMAILTTNP